MPGESTWNLMCTKWYFDKPLSPGHLFSSSQYYSTTALYSFAHHRSYIILTSLNKAFLGPTFCNIRRAHTFCLKEQHFTMWQSLPSYSPAPVYQAPRNHIPEVIALPGQTSTARACGGRNANCNAMPYPADSHISILHLHIGRTNGMDSVHVTSQAASRATRVADRNA